MRGALRVRSYADPPEALLDYPRWWLRRADRDAEPLTEAPERLEAHWDARGLRVQLKGIDDRDAAEQLRGREILVERAELPPTGPREYYRDELLGFAVRNGAGALLGELSHFVDAPAGALMVVRGEKRDRWLPASPPHLRRVDSERREIEVDWPEDF